MVKVKVEGETKQDRFTRLATQRTQEALNKLRILGNCANRDNYEYSDAEAEKILRAIDEEVKVLKQKFRSGKSGKKVFALV